MLIDRIVKLQQDDKYGSDDDKFREKQALVKNVADPECAERHNN